MVLFQRQNGSQQRRKNVSDEKNKCQKQGPFRWEQVLSDPRESHIPYRNLGVRGFKKRPHQALSLRHLHDYRTSQEKPLTLWHVKGKFQYLFNRVETFVAMKCRSAVSMNLLCCSSIFIISYKIQSDLKITGPVTLTRLNLMECPLQMNSPVNNVCLLSLICGFS